VTGEVMVDLSQGGVNRFRVREAAGRTE